jgi:nucleotide-binding universal stress UspA family protein
MIKSILALADGAAQLEATLRTAGQAARRLDAQLDVIAIGVGAVPAVVYAGEYSLPEPLLAAADATEAAGTRARGWCDQLSAAGTRVRWRQADSDGPAVLASLGRLADLVVLSRPGDGTVDSDTVQAALFETGRAVLVAPPTAMPSIGANVVIAWNDSIPAARAVAAAMPFVATAEQVTVLTAGDSIDAGNLLDYLDRYGVSAAVDRYEAGGSARARGRALLQRAVADGADLLVMGAYGEGRMAQFLGLGGATAKVITANTMPLLMAN